MLLISSLILSVALTRTTPWIRSCATTSTLMNRNCETVFKKQQEHLVPTYQFFHCMLHYSFLDYNNLHTEKSVSMTDWKAQLKKVVHKKYKLKRTSCEEYFVIVFKNKDENKCVLISPFIYALFKRECKRKLWYILFRWYRLFSFLISIGMMEHA